MRAESDGALLQRISWPAEASDLALQALAQHQGLIRALSTSEAPRDAPGTNLEAGTAAGEADLIAAAERLDCEIQSTEVSLGSLGPTLRSCGPALIPLPDLLPSGDGLDRPTGSARAPADPRVLAVVGCRFGRLALLDAESKVLGVPVERVARLLREPQEHPFRPQVDQIVDSLQLGHAASKRVRSSLLERQLAQRNAGPVWLLRPSRTRSILEELRLAGVLKEGILFVSSYFLSYGLLLASWWALGLGALSGHLASDWIWAWALLLASMMAPRLMSVWSRSRISILLGSLLKRKMLEGTLRTDPQSLRHLGAGRLLSRVLESEAVERYLLQGGFLTAAGSIELSVSVVVLLLGAGGWFHAGLLLAWICAIFLLARRHFRDRRAWTSSRLQLTHDMVENTVGHRTRQVQVEPQSWHAREDSMLSDYVLVSERLDRSQMLLMSFAPRGWVLVGFTGLVPAFVSNQASAVAVAIGLGGILAAFRGFSKAAEGFGHLANAWIAWEKVRSIVEKAVADPSEQNSGDEPRPQDLDVASFSSTETRDLESRRPLLEARQLFFRHEGRRDPVLAGCDLTIYEGDRWLLQGPSGCGKSTLASILAAGTKPDHGLLLLKGLDLPTWGAASWRRKVILVPQFHENHIYAGSLAFNLLMGRRWPPTHEDLALAAEICGDLGLGPLIERMPAGLQQPVGETGWQLSHGERSRVYLARALLQDGDLVILDETLAGLDPESAIQVSAAIQKRVRSMLIITHP